MSRLFSVPHPRYQVRLRIDRRLRGLRLRVLGKGLIEIAAPRQVPASLCDAMIEEHRSWIERQMQQEQQRQTRRERPDVVELAALGRKIPLHFEHHRERNGYEYGQGLKICFSHDEHWPPLLQQWLQGLAREKLGEYLQEAAIRTGLSFKGYTVRCQKTRWGSCSTHGNINLNRNLLFLKPPLVRYLMVHELCHTVHMNHSKDYWRLVERHEPDYRRLDHGLKAAVRDIPWWAMPWQL